MNHHLHPFPRRLLMRWGQLVRQTVMTGAVILSLAPAALAQASDPKLPPAAARAVTLAELLAFAERSAPSAQLARGRRALGAAARSAAAPLLHDNPTLTLGAGPRITGGERGLDIEAALSQPLELAGERGLRRAVASRFDERLEAELALAGLERRRDVELRYHAVVVAGRELVLATRVKELAERAFTVARRRLDAGEATRIELRVAEADTARARATELLAESELWSERVELARVVGWPANAPPTIAAELAPVARPAPLEALLGRRRPEHPELAVRAAATREASARVELADRRAWPNPTIELAFAREASVAGPPSYIALGRVALPLPLWSQNQGEREQSRAEAALVNTEWTLAQRERPARIARAHSALASAAERVQLLESSAGGALEDGLALLERSLEGGESSLLDLAAAREQLAAAQRDALAAYADYYRARAELSYELGSFDAGYAAGEPASEPGGAP